MKTKLEEKDGRWIATLEGELDTAAAIEVEATLQPLYESVGKDIVIDCTQLDYIASSGLRILLGILKKANANDNKMVLKNVNDNVKDVFRMTGFINIFQFE